MSFGGCSVGAIIRPVSVSVQDSGSRAGAGAGRLKPGDIKSAALAGEQRASVLQQSSSCLSCEETNMSGALPSALVVFMAVYTAACA